MRAFGHRQAVSALQLLDVPGAGEVLVLAEVNTAVQLNSARDNVQCSLVVMLPPADLCFVQVEPHTLQVVARDPIPHFVGDVLASRHAERVVPNGLFDVGAQLPGRFEFGGELAGRVAAHGAANEAPRSRTITVLLKVVE